MHCMSVVIVTRLECCIFMLNSRSMFMFFPLRVSRRKKKLFFKYLKNMCTKRIFNFFFVFGRTFFRFSRWQTVGKHTRLQPVYSETRMASAKWFIELITISRCWSAQANSFAHPNPILFFVDVRNFPWEMWKARAALNRLEFQNTHAALLAA